MITKEPSALARLAEDADWFDQEITLVDARGFEIGDGICIRAKDADKGELKVIKRTLVARNGNRFKLDRALRENAFLAGEPKVETLFPHFMAAHLKQIERVNPKVNAIVTLVPELAAADAAKADEMQAHGEKLGPLHGLPVAHKDLFETRGIRTTFGSPLFKDYVPAEDDIVVERMRHAGAITIGKTNTPEFGAGSQTFNKVFGATHNPYDVTKTCGGSTGRRRGLPGLRICAGRQRHGHRRLAAQSRRVLQRGRLARVAGRVPTAAQGDCAWSTISVHRGPWRARFPTWRCC